jgi:cell wall-associated NlpC family hydrolase
LQRSLTASVRKVPVTGYYGPITKAAVSSLQRSQGWRATGTVTPRVWRTLQAGRLVTVSLPKVSTLSASSGSSRGARALAFAKRQIGDRYRYGATGPSSWDCSGLTGGAWKAAGVKIPRTSQAQFRFGKRISKSNLRPGDLVFFYSGISHVGIYAGNGNVLHASRPSKPIGYLKMKYMPYQGARRPG